MDQIQSLLKENWEKLLVGFAGVLFLFSVVWPFIFPPATAKRSKAILDELNATVKKIQSSQPPKEEIPNFEEIIKKQYTESLIRSHSAQWTFFRKPFIWIEKYSGPQKVKKNPILNEPEDFNLTLTSAGVKLSWKHSKNNKYCSIVKTEIYRKVGDGSFEKIATLPNDGTEYVDVNVGPKMTYSYYIRCFAKAEENDEVNPFSSGKDQVESNTLTIRTLPEAIVEISSFQLGETVYNYILKSVGKIASWSQPPDEYKCPKGKEIKRITWNSNRQGKKAWGRFMIWKLNQEEMKIEEYVQNFQYEVYEGDHIYYLKTEWDKGKKKIRWIDSGFRLVRLGLGHIDKKVGNNIRESELPVVFLEPKSINQTMLDIGISPFGLDGVDRIKLLPLAKGEGIGEKIKAEKTLKKLTAGSRK